jgi:fatty acid desaturase
MGQAGAFFTKISLFPFILIAMGYLPQFWPPLYIGSLLWSEPFILHKYRCLAPPEFCRIKFAATKYSRWSNPQKNPIEMPTGNISFRFISFHFNYHLVHRTIFRVAHSSTGVFCFLFTFKIDGIACLNACSPTGAPHFVIDLG